MRTWRHMTSFGRAFLVGCVLGGVGFVLCYGALVINPTYTAWLENGNDLQQHYYGWEFFRQSDWSFPLGVIGDLAYPNAMSVTYTDSIPLLAIPFKAISGLLPAQFQYFGAWGFLSLILQGGIGALIMHRFTRRLALIALGSAVFVFAPVLAGRMFVHTALASQWLILLAIYIILRQRNMSMKWFVSIWAGLLGVGVLVHPYFMPMLAAMCVVAALLNFARVREWIAAVGVPLAMALAAFWVSGGFVFREVSAGGLGDHAMNLTAPLNPLGMSFFVPNTSNSSSWESLNYLGLGVIVATAILGILLARYCTSSTGRRQLIMRIRAWRFRHYLAGLTVIALAVLAISPRVQFASHIIADIPLPAAVEKLWGIFRATGRLFWPVYYLYIALVLGGTIYFTRSSRAWLVGILFVAIAVMQAADLRLAGNVQAKYLQLSARQAASSYNTAWDGAAEGRAHIVYFGRMESQEFYLLGQVGLANDLTLNTGYFARSPEREIYRYQQEQQAAVLRGNPDPVTMYVLKDDALASQLRSASGLRQLDLDGLHVLY